jgi:hypothetical protein
MVTMHGCVSATSMTASGNVRLSVQEVYLDQPRFKAVPTGNRCGYYVVR